MVRIYISLKILIVFYVIISTIKFYNYVKIMIQHLIFIFNISYFYSKYY